MSGFIERLLGSKADELRSRMERSIIVSKKLTAAMEELTKELKAHRKAMENLLEEARRE